MHSINYVDRIDGNGNSYKDINDYFIGGFTSEDLGRMMKLKKNKKTKIKKNDKKKTNYMTQEQGDKLALLDKNPFIYLRKYFSYYDKRYNKLAPDKVVPQWVGCSNKEANKMLSQ